MDSNSPPIRPEPRPGHLTALLERCQGSDVKARQQAENELFDLVYPDLRAIAKHAMLKERPDHTLQPTALVNQAYFKLLPKVIPYENRRHFFGAAFRAMWQILVNHARERSTIKRKPPGVRLDFTKAENVALEKVVDVLELDDALEKLARDNLGQELAEIVRWRVFGLKYKEIAEMLEVGETRVRLMYYKACSRLREFLKEMP